MVCHQGQVMHGIGTYKRRVNSATDFGEYDAANMNAATYMQRLQGDGAPCWVSRISRTIAHHGEPPVRRASPLKGNAAVSCAATIKSRYTSRWERIVMDESQAIMIVISRYELTAPWCWWCASALMLCGFNTIINTINRCWIHTLCKQKKRWVSFECVQHSIDGCVCLRMCDSGVWCIPSVVDWYTPSEASESKIADCPGWAVFTCARNSPIVLFDVLFKGVTVCAWVIMRRVCTVVAVWPSICCDGWFHVHKKQPCNVLMQSMHL